MLSCALGMVSERSCLYYASPIPSERMRIRASLSELNEITFHEKNLCRPMYSRRGYATRTVGSRLSLWAKVGFGTFQETCSAPRVLKTVVRE
jgi:hypothetical protein